MKQIEKISVSPLPTEKKTFNEVFNEATSLSGALGREINLKSVDTGVKKMIYLVTEKKTFGFISDSSQLQEVAPLVESGCYKAFVTGTEGNRLEIAVIEQEERQTPVDEKEAASKLEDRLKKAIKNNLIAGGKTEAEAEEAAKADVEDRLKYMKTFGLNPELSPLYNIFLEKMVTIMEDRVVAGEKLPEKPRVPYLTHNKKADGNPMLSIARGWVSNRPTILEGQMGQGKDVAFETFAWLTGCELIRLQWHGRTTKGDAMCHESTDNETKNSLSVEGLGAFLNYIADSLKIKLFKKEKDNEKDLKFGLDVIKSMSPSLKMENGPILEALELAARGIGVILLNDEMNLADPNTLAGFINDLADGHSPEIYVSGKGKVPVNHSKLFLAGTQNGVGGDYIGTRKQNAATMSRFKVVKLDPPKTIIGILRTAKYEVDEATVELIDKIYKEYSKGVEVGEYPMSSLNIRGMKAAVDDVYLGCSIKTAVSQNINNALQSDDDTDMLDTVVDTIMP